MTFNFDLDLNSSNFKCISFCCILMVVHILSEVQVKPDKPVFVMSWEGKKPKLPSILLNSHMDVVPVFPVSMLQLLYYLCMYRYVFSVPDCIVVG